MRQSRFGEEQIKGERQLRAAVCSFLGGTAYDGGEVGGRAR